MRIGPVLIVVGALTLGACAASSDVRSTGSSSNVLGEQLPPVDDPDVSTPATSPVTPPSTITTVPGTRPADFDSRVLVPSDLPGWDVAGPMDVPGEPTWEALDCPDMNTVWGATGRAGTRSRGTNGGASFRNTAVEFTTAPEAAAVLDAVDRVWTECTVFDSDLSGTFWSEPIVMPASTLRTAGIVIGNASQPNWTLAFWQVDTMVVVLEIEGDDMWTFLDPLLVTMSARLDGTPTPIQAPTPPIDEPPAQPPVLVPATSPPVDVPVSTTTEPQDDTFPPLDEDWAEHALAHLAPTPDSLGPGWVYEHGRTNQAEPADPDDAIDGCDAPVPTPLDGYNVDYRNRDAEAEIELLVGEGSAAESQSWIDALRGIAGCDLDPEQFLGNFDLVEAPIDGTDDSVMIAGSFDNDVDARSLQVIGAVRVDGVLIAAFVAVAASEVQTVDDAVALVVDVLRAALAKR